MSAPGHLHFTDVLQETFQLVGAGKGLAVQHSFERRALLLTRQRMVGLERRFAHKCLQPSDFCPGGNSVEGCYQTFRNVQRLVRHLWWKYNSVTFLLEIQQC